MFCVFFFFFQAEDGIRDSSVTGVQTCALPISLADHDSAPGAAHDCESLRKSCLRCLPASHSAAERLKWLVLPGGARAPPGLAGARASKSSLCASPAWYRAP